MEDDAADAIRECHRQGSGQGPSARVPPGDRPVDPGGVEDRDQVRGDVWPAIGIGVMRLVAVAVARADRHSGPDGRPRGGPHIRVAPIGRGHRRARDEQDRRARSRLVVADRVAARQRLPGDDRCRPRTIGQAVPRISGHRGSGGRRHRVPRIVAARAPEPDDRTDRDCTRPAANLSREGAAPRRRRRRPASAGRRRPRRSAASAPRGGTGRGPPRSPPRRSRPRTWTRSRSRTPRGCRATMFGIRGSTMALAAVGHGGEDPRAEIARAGQVELPAARALERVDHRLGHAGRDELGRDLRRQPVGEQRPGDREADRSADLLEERQAARRDADPVGRHGVLDDQREDGERRPDPEPGQDHPQPEGRPIRVGAEVRHQEERRRASSASEPNISSL